MNTVMFYPSKITLEVFNSVPFMKNCSSHCSLAEQTAQITGCLSEQFVFKVKQSLFTSVFTHVMQPAPVQSALSWLLLNRTVLRALICVTQTMPSWATAWNTPSTYPGVTAPLRTQDIPTAARNKAGSTASPLSVLDAILEFHVWQ